MAPISIDVWRPEDKVTAMRYARWYWGIFTAAHASLGIGAIIYGSVLLPRVPPEWYADLVVGGFMALYLIASAIYGYRQWRRCGGRWGRSRGPGDGQH